MAAPSLVAVAFVEGAPAINATQSTPTSVSWQTGDVVIAMGGTEDATNNTWVAPTTAGTGLSFTLQQSKTVTSSCGAGCFACVASANGSGTFSWQSPRTSGSAVRFANAYYVFRGSAGVGLSSVGEGSGRTLALTPSGADGSIVWGVFDWSASSVQTATPTASSHTTTTPGPQASPQAAVGSGASYTYYIEELDDQTSAGATSYGIGGTGTGPFSIIAIEVKASGGGGTTVKPRRVRNDVPIIRAANF